MSPRRLARQPWLHASVATTLSLIALAGCGGQQTAAVLKEAPPAATGEPADDAPRRLVTSGEPTYGAYRAPNTTPITNIAGMLGAEYAPTNRSTFMDVSPDGERVGIVWLHNADAKGAFSITGEPTTYATIGNPADPSSFSPPSLVGKRMYEYGTLATDAYKKFNMAHNAPFMLATPKGGFLALSNPMNANGYAEKLTPTGYGYATSEAAPGSTAWSNPGLQKLTSYLQGSSLSEMTGNMDPDGGIHLFGQGHLGIFQGGFGYQHRRPGAGTMDGITVSMAYRPTGMNYFCDGGGYVSPVANSQGEHDVHVTWAYNKQGDMPLWGLYYLRSRDGGRTWQNGRGQTVTLPINYGKNDSQAAIVRAGLTEGGTYSGDLAGAMDLNVSATDTGQPLIIRPIFTDATRTYVQHWLYTYTGGRWIRVTVGPKLFWNSHGSGLSYNARTGTVNVMLLDSGSYRYPAQVLLYSQPLSSLNAVSYKWDKEVVASLPQKHYASSMQVREVKDTRFVVLFESEYQNPGRVQPVLLEAPMH